MLSSLWRWQAKQATARFDWVFLVFLIFAACMSGWSYNRVCKQKAAYVHLEA
jgi:hypothetical protein